MVVNSNYNPLSWFLRWKLCFALCINKTMNPRRRSLCGGRKLGKESICINKCDLTPVLTCMIKDISIPTPLFQHYWLPHQHWPNKYVHLLFPSQAAITSLSAFQERKLLFPESFCNNSCMNGGKREKGFNFNPLINRYKNKKKLVSETGNVGSADAFAYFIHMFRYMHFILAIFNMPCRLHLFIIYSTQYGVV